MVKLNYNILILEDELSWQDRIIEGIERNSSCSYFRASNVADAKRILKTHCIHAVSIDQRVPSSSTDGVADENGIIFCEEIPDNYPLAKRTMFTAHGEVNIVNLVAKSDVEYLEKRTMEPGVKDDALTGRTYGEWLGKTLNNNYINWALSKAANVLPPGPSQLMLELERYLSNAINSGDNADWTIFFNHLDYIRELVVEISWCLSLVLLRSSRTQYVDVEAQTKFANKPRPYDFEKSLREVWPKLKNSGWMANWDSYISYENDKCGKKFLEAVSSLRNRRNRYQHPDPGEIGTYSMEDFELHKGDILSLIDNLAFLGSLKFSHRIRYHPTKRGFLQFTRLNSPSPEPTEAIHDIYDKIPAMSDKNVFLPWVGPKKQNYLLDLTDNFFASRKKGRIELKMKYPILGAGELIKSLKEA